MVAASPRNWSSALCRYARYWISGTGSIPASPAPNPSPSTDVSSSRVSKTRAAPNLSRSPLVTPYTPPLAATSSPKTASSGWLSIPSASAALMLCARVSGPASSGGLPPNASTRLAASGPAARCAARATTVATRSGRRGDSGATTSAGLASFGSSSTSSAVRRTCQPRSS